MESGRFLVNTALGWYWAEWRWLADHPAVVFIEPGKPPDPEPDEGPAPDYAGWTVGVPRSGSVCPECRKEFASRDCRCMNAT